MILRKYSLVSRNAAAPPQQDKQTHNHTAQMSEMGHGICLTIINAQRKLDCGENDYRRTGFHRNWGKQQVDAQLREEESKSEQYAVDCTGGADSGRVVQPEDMPHGRVVGTYAQIKYRKIGH